MISDTSNLAQWTELGAQLSGPDGDSRRQEIFDFLDNLENRIQADLRNPSTIDCTSLNALSSAVETSKEILQIVLKPVDLSAL
ncbi:MAG: hypothetical protein NTZ08_14230 [Verrucomicrobia bacterium]|nr:hypothetical protein [Verrucomicrobiota bacterium]